jgi:hypothetical protein
MRHPNGGAWLLFSERPAWIARNPEVRRIAVETWRRVLRMQRATAAKAVLIVKDKDGRILTMRAASGALHLPAKALDALLPITTQVQELIEQVLSERVVPSLVAVHGTPSAEGVAFLYAATLNASANSQGGIWLEPGVAAVTLGGEDNRLLHRCASCSSAASTAD